MSDPVTNVEIEDVLSSIRRLVSDGDKARTRDTAPIEAPIKAPVEAAIEPEAPVHVVETDESLGDVRPDRFVLTPAFMVADRDTQSDDTADDAVLPEATPEPALEPETMLQEALPQDDLHVERPDHHFGEVAETSDDASATLTETVRETLQADFVEQADVDAAPVADVEQGADVALVADVAHDNASSDDAASASYAPDRSELVATIAELEAAISNDVDEYEPDGSEVDASEHMAETIAWPGSTSRPFDEIEDAETAIEADSQGFENGDDNRVMPFQRSTTDQHVTDAPEAAIDDVIEQTAGATVDDAEPPMSETDVFADDDLDEFLEVGGVTMDEAALRSLVSDVVREELAGPLGERITRKVRKLVRREIYRVLSSQDFE